jgi:2-keto-3-deoxy-L-rhamnonate aldolase RhmA
MSRLSEQLGDGGVVVGAGASTFAPSVIEVYGSLGLDYVWLDLEHKGPSPADSQSLEQLARAADAGDVELLVRLPTADPWLVRTVLDTGVSNVLLARVETAAEVRRAARATTVSYDGNPGERGVGVCRASDWGTGGYEPTNESPGLGVMVETAAAIDNLEEILDVPGLDFVYPGAADLAISLGHPFEADDPVVEEAITGVVDASLDAGVPLGQTVSGPEGIPDAVSDGWRLLRFGDELDAVRQRVDAFLGQLPPGPAKE